MQADSLPSEPPGKLKSLRQTSMFGILGLFKFSFFKDYNFFTAMFYKNFNLIFILYWSRTDLQCCVVFRCPADCYTHRHSFSDSVFI